MYDTTKLYKKTRFTIFISVIIRIAVNSDSYRFSRSFSSDNYPSFVKQKNKQKTKKLTWSKAFFFVGWTGFCMKKIVLLKSAKFGKMFPENFTRYFWKMIFPYSKKIIFKLMSFYPEKPYINIMFFIYIDT